MKSSKETIELKRMQKLAGLLNEGVNKTMISKTVKNDRKKMPIREEIANYSVVMGMYVTDVNRAYDAYQEAQFAQEELKKAGIKSEILVQVRVSKSDERKSIKVLSDVGIDNEQQVKI